MQESIESCALHADTRFSFGGCRKKHMEGRGNNRLVRKLVAMCEASERRWWLGPSLPGSLAIPTASPVVRHLLRNTTPFGPHYVPESIVQVESQREISNDCFESVWNFCNEYRKWNA